MAAQVTNWLYDDMTKAHWANATWSYSKTEDTLAKLFKYFSSTPQLEAANFIYDHAIDNNYGLIIRPITGTLEDGVSCTGVFDCTISETQDNKWKGEENAIYGQFMINDLVPMVWRACGLQVDEEHQLYYLGKVQTHLIATRSRANAHIINSAGTVCCCVNKEIIDLIIEAMDLEGMFDTHSSLPDTIPAGDIVMDGGGSFTQCFNYCVSNLQSGVWSQLVSENPSYSGFIVSPSRALSDLASLFSNNGVSISDYAYGLVSASYTYPIPGFQLTKYVSLTIYNIRDDTFTLYGDVNTNIPTGAHGKAFSLTNSNIRQRTDGNCYSGYISYTYDTITHNITAAPYWVGSTNTPEELAMYAQNYKDDDDIYRVSARMCNWNVDEIYPEGISVLEGATPGRSGTTSSDFWPSWTSRAVTLQTVSVDTYDFDTETFIPIGYCNPVGDTTQIDMQLGKIRGREYLQKLGVNVSNIEEYDPIIDPDPDDPDPIIPDPEPDPDPTPDDPDPSDASAKLYSVHALSAAEVGALGTFLFSADFISAIQNMFAEPLDCIIACYTLYYHGTLPVGANERLKLGSVLGTGGVTGDRVSERFFTIDFGSVKVPEFYGNVEDYAPYTTVEIYLPYIGFCPLETNDIMNASVKLIYTIDTYSGACVAKIYCTKKGVKQELYNFNGNTAVQIPLTGRDFTQGVVSVISAGIGLLSGEPTAMVLGASRILGSPYSIRRSGNVGANMGAMSNQTPYIIVKRPKAYNAANYPYFYGQPSWWSTTLGRLSGYTRVKEAHLDGIVCTEEEREEILQLLLAGVMV